MILDSMTKDKITFTISKKTLLIIFIALIIFFLPIPSYETIPTQCEVPYISGINYPPCPPPKQGWILTKPIFFRIVDFVKSTLFPQHIEPTGSLEELGEGITEGGTVNSGESPLGNAATEEECLAIGGVWRPWGMLGKEYCQITATDANQACNDGSECQYGKCISENGEIPGKCAEFKHMFGCLSLIENGQVGSTLCID